MWQRALSSSGGGGGGSDESLYKVYVDGGNGIHKFVNGSTTITVGGNYAAFYCKKYSKITSPANNGFYIYIFDEEGNQLQYIELGTVTNLSLPANAAWIEFTRLNYSSVNIKVTFVE